MKPNSSGHIFEETLAANLRSNSVQFMRQVPIGHSIYGLEYQLRADFVLENLRDFPAGLAVEAKWQDVGGSVDEKFPYLVANIQQQYVTPAIIVVAGGGCRSGAFDWLTRQCDGRQLLHVFSLDEFLSWIMRIEKRSRSLFVEPT